MVARLHGPVATPPGDALPMMTTAMALAAMVNSHSLVGAKESLPMTTKTPRFS